MSLKKNLKKKQQQMAPIEIVKVQSNEQQKREFTERTYQVIKLKIIRLTKIFKDTHTKLALSLKDRNG